MVINVLVDIEPSECIKYVSKLKSLRNMSLAKYWNVLRLRYNLSSYMTVVQATFILFEIQGIFSKVKLQFQL